MDAPSGSQDALRTCARREFWNEICSEAWNGVTTSDQVMHRWKLRMDALYAFFYTDPTRLFKQLRKGFTTRSTPSISADEIEKAADLAGLLALTWLETPRRIGDTPVWHQASMELISLSPDPPEEITPEQILTETERILKLQRVVLEFTNSCLKSLPNDCRDAIRRMYHSSLEDWAQRFYLYRFWLLDSIGRDDAATLAVHDAFAVCGSGELYTEAAGRLRTFMRYSPKLHFYVSKEPKLAPILFEENVGAPALLSRLSVASSPELHKMIGKIMSVVKNLCSEIRSLAGDEAAVNELSIDALKLLKYAFHISASPPFTCLKINRLDEILQSVTQTFPHPDLLETVLNKAMLILSDCRDAAEMNVYFAANETYKISYFSWTLRIARAYDQFGVQKPDLWRGVYDDALEQLERVASTGRRSIIVLPPKIAGQISRRGDHATALEIVRDSVRLTPPRSKIRLTALRALKKYALQAEDQTESRRADELIKTAIRELIEQNLSGHPKPAIDGHLKTGQRRKHSGH